jgi:glycosyltransferase involved in cell wall biosynthesis
MDTGGAEMLVAQLCRRQRAAGHVPRVDCLFRLGALGERLRRDGIAVEVYPASSRLQLMWRIWRRFREERIEVVHCHNATPAFVAAIPARAAGAHSIVVTRHGLVPPPYSWRREVKVSAAVRLSNAQVVAVCEVARQNLANAPWADPSRIQTIYNGTELLPPETPTPVPRKEGFTLLNVGRLTVAKDQATLLRAFASAVRTAPDLRLWIAGDGALAPALRELCRELGLERLVHLLGDRTDISNLLAHADLFVMSSISEGLPVSLLEALAAGVPVLTTSVGGMTEVVTASGSGRLVAPKDAEALAAAILDMRQLGPRLAEMAKSGRRYFEEHFTAGHMEQAYEELYRRN